jgi:hypothetical protein
VRAILLGPQRRPTLGSLEVPGPFVTVTAGWQEREPDDGELRSLLGGDAVGLALYQRWLDVQERDPEYAAAARGLADELAELADLYLLRLDYALQAVYALQHRDAGVALGEAVEAVRALDAAHLARVNEVRGEFFDRLRPHDRPVIAAHRASVASALASAAALVVAGGHVGVLAEVLHLFNVAASLPSSAAVIAWSAGAMAMADRIVLFGDRSAHGPGHAEVYGSGLSVVRDLVLLPHAKARLLLDDAPRMAVFARRFAPARCVLLEAGTRVEVSARGDLPAGARVLGLDGRVCSLGEAA